MSVATALSLVIAVVALLISGVEMKLRRRDSAELRKRLRREEIAYLGARQQASRNEQGDFVYMFSLTNAGPAVAREIVARLVDWDEEAGPGHEDEVARDYVKAAMPRGGEVTIELRVPQRLRDRDLRLWASWSDDSDERHEDHELLRVRTPREYRSAGFS
jgi:hypothetical protein